MTEPKSIDISSSFPFIQSKKLSVCLKCLAIPKIQIDNNNTKIHIVCNCEVESSLDQYLKQLLISSDKCTNHQDVGAVAYCVECKTFLCPNCLKYHEIYIDNQHQLINEKTFLIPQCSIHKKDKEFYCEKCKEYLCEDCKNNHNQEHTFFNIPSMTSKINIEEINEKIKEAEEYLNDTYPKIKQEYLKQLEKEYEDSLKKNKNILEFYSIMMDNFIPNRIINYNLARNINKVHLHFPEYNEEDNYMDFLYYNNIIYVGIREKEKFHLSAFHSIKTIQEHTSFVNSLCVLKDGRLVSGSDDKTIKVYDPKNEFNCDFTIETEHSSSVLNVCVLDDGKLVSCSYDKTIKIWDINNKSYQCLTTLYGHTQGVNKVIGLPSNRIASCSDDKTIKIWDSKLPYECIQTLNGHTSYVRSVLLMSDIKNLVSGSTDYTLSVWDSTTYNNKGNTEDVYCCDFNSLIEIDTNKVAVGGDSILKIVNIQTAQIEREIQYSIKGNIYALLLLRDDNILIADEYGNIYLYEILKKKCDKKKKCHYSSIHCLMNLDDDIIVSCSFDKSIKIWSE